MSARIVIHRHRYPDLLSLIMREERRREQHRAQSNQGLQVMSLNLETGEIAPLPSVEEWAKEFVKDITSDKLAHIKECPGCKKNLRAAHDSGVDVTAPVRVVLGLTVN